MAQEDAGLGEIVVTATRRAESVQTVPISMQALGAEKMEQRQVKGLSDLATLMPSVSFAGIGPGRNTAFFRGIVPAGGAYASVGYYLDDIPITGTDVPDIHVYDLERVEALSGPQVRCTVRGRWPARSGSSPTSRSWASWNTAMTWSSTNTARAISARSIRDI